MFQYLSAGAHDIVGRDGIDAVARMARNDGSRSVAAPEPFGVGFVEYADVGYAGALRNMRGAAIIGHHQARAQHDGA